MASELNTNELNRLENDGRMPSDSVGLEDKKTLEEIEGGRKTIEELPQLISPTRILDEAQHNDIYKLILGPCAAEGFSVNQKIIELLKDKKIKPIDLESTLDDVMQEIITYVNGNDKYPVMFTDTGKIDVEETVQKAQRTGRTVSQYVASLAEDSGKSVEELRAKETIFGLEIAMNRSKEEYDLLNKIFSPKIEEYNEKIDDFLGRYANDWVLRNNDDGTKTVQTKLSKDANMAINILINIEKFLENNASNVGARKENLQDLLRVYEYLKNTDWINDIPAEQRDDYLKLIENAREVIKDKCKLYYNKDITNEEEYDAILGYLALSKENLGSIEDCKVFKKIEENLKKINLDKVNIDIDAYKLREKDEIITLIRAFNYSLSTMREFNTYNSTLTQRALAYNKAVMDRLANAFPEYYREAMDDKKGDEYATVRLLTLRELKAKELFQKRFDDPDHEPHRNSDMNLKDFQVIKIAAGILKSNGYSKDIRKMAMDVIVRFCPDVELDINDQQELINLKNVKLSKKLDEFIDNVQKESMNKALRGSNKLEIMNGDDFAYSGMHSLDMIARSSLTAEMIKKARGEKLEFSVLNNEEYRRLYDEKVNEVNDKLYDVKYMESLTRDITSTIRDIEAGKELNTTDEAVFVKKLVMAIKELKKNEMPEIELMVKEYLIDYLPEAFRRGGGFDVNVGRIEEKLADYLHNKGLDPEDINEIDESVSKDLEEKTKDAISKTKITTDILYTAEKASRDFTEGLNIEKRLENLEDQIRFVNYILRRKDTLTPEKQAELEKYAEIIITDRKNAHEMKFKRLKQIEYDPLEEHENFDENKVKTKFTYLEKEARKLVATERINENIERYKDGGIGSITEKEEIQGVLGTYMGILNDYKNEELNASDYRVLIGKLTSLMKKIDPSLLNEDGVIDEDRALELYNQINGAEFENIEEASKYEETELLMRYTRRLSREVELKSKDGSKYIGIIDDKNLYIKYKIQEVTKREVNLNTKTTTELVSDVWNIVKADAEGRIAPNDIQLVASLALAEGAFGAKQLRKKGLSYEEGLVQELELKTLTVARQKLAEIFPEAFKKEDGSVDRTRLIIAIQDYFEKNDPEIEERLGNGETIFEALKSQREEQYNRLQGPRLKVKTVEQLLNDAKDFLKGGEKEKTFGDNVALGRMVVGMVDRFGQSEMKQRLLKRLSKQVSEDQRAGFIETVESRKLDFQTENAFRRLGGIKVVESFQNQFRLAENEKIGDLLQPVDRAKYMMLAAGAAMACDKLPNDGANIEAKELITKYMKKLAPKTVNASGEINYDKVRLEVNRCNATSQYNSIRSKQYDMDQFVNKAMNKIDMSVAMNLYENKIDSRFTSKYYVPNMMEQSRQLTPAEIGVMIANADMDKIMSARGEEIVVDTSQLRAQQEERKKEDEVITGEEFDSKFAEVAVEIGGEDPKKVEATAPEVAEVSVPKVEQQVVAPSQGVRAENIEVADDTWRENLPVEQKQKGFLGSIFDKIKAGIKTVKDKIFGTSENNTAAAGTTDNNATTAGTGGVNKDEQNVEALTGHGKIKLEFGTPVSQTASTESKGKDSKSGGEPEHDEEVL